jgi:hypothetical protein
VLVYCINEAGKVLERMIFSRSSGPVITYYDPDRVTPDFIEEDRKLFPTGMTKLVVIDNKDNIQDLVG